MNAKTMKYVNMVSEVLVGVAAVNWGALEFFNTNLVELLSTNSVYLMVVYGLVATAGLYKLGKVAGLIK